MNTINSLEVIKNQLYLGHVGKVLFINGASGEHLGYCSLKTGVMGEFHYKKKPLKLAIESLVFDELNPSQKIKSIVEAEVNSTCDQSLELKWSDFKKFVDQSLSKLKMAKKLKPAKDLVLFPLGSNNLPLSPVENQVLQKMGQCSKAEDLYKNLNLADFEITFALIALRRNKIIGVR